MEKDYSRAIKNGDKEAFGEFYRQNWKHIHLSTLKLVRSEELAKDLLQESFIKLWETRASIDETADLLPLLYTIIRHRFINHLKREEIWKNKQDTLGRSETNPADTPYEDLVAKELGLEISHVFEKMPAGVQKVWNLHRNAHLSIPEIADELQISPLTVKKQLSNALKLFRQRLGNMY